MGLTRLGRFTLTLAVLALLGYWVYTHPEILERLRTPRVPAPTPPPPQAPGGLSARERGRVQYQAGDYAGAIASLGRAITANPFDVESLTLRENPFTLLPGKPVWRIAVAGPSTGPDKQCGQQVLFGVYYAQRQANQAGGLRGRKVVVNFYDDQAAAEEAVRVAQTIAAAPQVLALVGHCNSTATRAAGPLYESGGIPGIPPHA